MFKQNSPQYSVGLITNVKDIYDNNNQWSGRWNCKYTFGNLLIVYKWSCVISFEDWLW